MSNILLAVVINTAMYFSILATTAILICISPNQQTEVNMYLSGLLSGSIYAIIIALCILYTPTMITIGTAGLVIYALMITLLAIKTFFSR